MTWPTADDFDLTETQAWDRQHSEPTKAYAAFRMYRDQPSSQRNLQAVAEAVGVTARMVRRWAQNWDWRNRADAWDDTCHRAEDQERLEAIRSMHAVHRRVGRAAITKAALALQALNPESMPPSIIARLLDLGAKLERSTLIVSVEELQGIDAYETEEDDPWERIARELDPAHLPDL